VTITNAVFRIRNSRLQVTATSTDPTGAAQLTLHVPGFPDTLMTNKPPVCVACTPNTYAANLTGIQLDPTITTVSVTSSEGGFDLSPITRVR
jgi:hypothetical protein